jgi:hypothetical protein
VAQAVGTQFPLPLSFHAGKDTFPLADKTQAVSLSRLGDIA